MMDNRTSHMECVKKSVVPRLNVTTRYLLKNCTSFDSTVFILSALIKMRMKLGKKLKNSIDIYRRIAIKNNHSMQYAPKRCNVATLY